MLTVVTQIITTPVINGKLHIRVTKACNVTSHNTFLASDRPKILAIISKHISKDYFKKLSELRERLAFSPCWLQ